MILPPQQAKTQRMRLKMRSNPNEDEGGLQPITVVLTIKAEARMKFFPMMFHLYSYSRI